MRCYLASIDSTVTDPRTGCSSSDVICIPASQLTPQERHMAGDVLVELMRSTDAQLRESVAKRLVMLNEAPRTILVLLAKDDIKIARHVLEKSKSLTDSDLIQIAQKVSTEHRKMIAQRRKVSDSVVDVIVQFLEEDVVETLLRNKGAEFSETALQRILTVSRGHQPYVELLTKRVELRPSHGLTMFWWADQPNRKKILARFAVTRKVLQESCGDLFQKAAHEGWNDSGVRKALQFVERRQRNRAAAERSKFEGLEGKPYFTRRPERSMRNHSPPSIGAWPSASGVPRRQPLQTSATPSWNGHAKSNVPGTTWRNVRSK